MLQKVNCTAFLLTMCLSVFSSRSYFLSDFVSVRLALHLDEKCSVGHRHTSSKKSARISSILAAIENSNGNHFCTHQPNGDKHSEAAAAARETNNGKASGEKTLSTALHKKTQSVALACGLIRPLRSSAFLFTVLKFQPDVPGPATTNDKKFL